LYSSGQSPIDRQYTTPFIPVTINFRALSTNAA
jgi:hypothetical protein